MTYVITQNCVNDASCVPVCPVNCIHPTPDEPDYGTAEMLYIDPDVCIDCGACFDVCPVKAIEPDFDLQPQDLPFVDLNAQYYRDPAHQGYDPTPAKTARPLEEWTTTETLRVAIVGTGPAACYAAEELVGRRGLDVRVDMFERLPVPWGLLRFGVAPDHQGTKAAGDDFARTLRHPNVRLFLDVEVGSAVTHETLAERYHAVIYAVGAMADRRLGIPGEALPGSHSATEFVAWYNGHPDFADRSFDLSGERAVIIGNGNVALDVARILLTDIDKLRRTDIADHALIQLEKSNVREVVVVGRRGPAQAAFTAPELVGLAQTAGIEVCVEADEVTLDEATRNWSRGREESIALYKAKLISELGRTGYGAGSSRRATLRFGWSPVRLVGASRVEEIHLARNELVCDGEAIVARSTDEIEELATGLVLRSVGYRGVGIAGLPFDERRGVLPNVQGRVVDPSTELPVGGIYAAGWIKRGPSGVIGTNKHCARETVSALLEDWVAGELTLVAGADAGDIADALPDHLDLGGWTAIDGLERAAGRASSRPRVKLVQRDDMVAAARSAGAPVSAPK